MSYFCQTLAKLAVYNPELLPPLSPEMEVLTNEQIKNRLVALLAYYKGLDDDAALALEIWSRHGFPRWGVGDFKSAWGILGGGKIEPPKVKIGVQPHFVPSLSEEVVALKEALLAGRPPEICSLTPSWKPSQLPDGYQHLIDAVQTRHAPGLGEIAIHLAWSSTPDFTGVTSIAERGWWVPKAYLAAARRKFPDEKISVAGNNVLAIGSDKRENDARAAAIGFLTSGIFPIWRVGEVRPESLGEWKASRPTVATADNPRVQFSREVA
jgi:hypothetical protein